MHTKVLALIVLAAIGLAGCATTGPTSSTPAQVVSQVQNIALQICKFLPTAATVTDIFLTGNATLQTAEQVANAICAAVAPVKQGRSRLRGAPMVNGIAIHGKFVN